MLNRKKSQNPLLILALLAAGCGGGGSGGTQVPTSPVNTSPNVTVFNPDGYENDSNVGFTLHAEDSDGIASSTLKYFVPEEHIILLNPQSGGLYSGTLPPLPSGRFSYQASATDTTGLTRIVNGEFVRYATAENANAMMLPVLLNYQAQLKIEDIKIPSTIEAPDPDDPTNNIIIAVDAKFRLQPSGIYAVIWYTGKDDGDYAVEKAALDSISTHWLHLNPCPASEIPSKISTFIDTGCISDRL